MKKDLIPAFDMVLSMLKPISPRKKNKALKILANDSIYDMFDYLEKDGCFPKGNEKLFRAYLGIELHDYEPGENYAELNEEKLIRFLDALGLDK